MTTTAPPSPSSTLARADNSHMSFGAYVFMGTIYLALGLFALYVSRTYAHANLIALGLDKDALSVRGYSIDLLLLSDIVLVFTASMMPRVLFSKMRFWLLALALGIWAFDMAATYQGRIGIVMQGTTAAESTDLHTSQLKASIESARATAKGLRQSAEKQATSIFPASRADGAASLRAAADADQRAEAMTAQLATVSKSRAPTEESVWKSWTPWKMFAEAMLISLINMAMFILAGEMVRAARDVRGATAAKPTSATAPTPKTAAPKASTLPRWTVAMPKASPAYAAAAVPLSAMGAPLATFAPPLPTPPSISIPSVVKPSHHAPACVIVQTRPVQANVITQTQPAEVKTITEKPVKAKKSRTAKPVTDGKKMDSGTEGKTAARYKRIKAAVIAGTLKPSTRSLNAAEGAGNVVSCRYLAKLAEEGVIERKGRVWVLTAKYKAQLTLQGV